MNYRIVILYEFRMIILYRKGTLSYFPFIVVENFFKTVYFPTEVKKFRGIYH